MCSICKTEHETTRKGTICLGCKALQDKKYRQNNKTKIALANKDYHNKNSSKIAANKKVYREENRGAIAAGKKTWAENNREYLQSYHKQYSVDNAEKANERAKAFYAANEKRIIQKHLDKLKTDLNYKIKSNLRIRLCQIVKNKSGRTLDLLGIDFVAFKKHLESNFKPDMSWDNYGLKGWTIDHIKPLSRYDLTDETQLKEACHYTNLQPLWFAENSSKGNRYEL